MPTTPQYLVQRRKGCMCPVSLANTLASSMFIPARQVGRIPLEFSAVLTFLSCVHMASEARGSLPDHQGTICCWAHIPKRAARGGDVATSDARHTPHTAQVVKLMVPECPAWKHSQTTLWSLGLRMRRHTTWNCLPRKQLHTCRTDSGYLCPTPNELSPPTILHESTVSHSSAELSVVTLNSGHTGSNRNTKCQTNAPLAQEWQKVLTELLQVGKS